MDPEFTETATEASIIQGPNDHENMKILQCGAKAFLYSLR